VAPIEDGDDLVERRTGVVSHGANVLRLEKRPEGAQSAPRRPIAHPLTGVGPGQAGVLVDEHGAASDAVPDRGQQRHGQPPPMISRTAVITRS
jgi:hypothetical protein